MSTTVTTRTTTVPTGPTTAQVWDAIHHASFGVLGHVTPAGQPRTSGVMFTTIDDRLHVVVAPDSWKARHIALDGHVSMTVTVRRGGLLALVAPIPPATITFRGNAVVHPPDDPATRRVVERLATAIPEERLSGAAVVEIVPEGEFLTYGVGVPLLRMRDPAASRGRVPVR
jgi:hypothetical protein